jgi:hypothetical protein
MVTWLMLETLARFTGDVACTIAELLLASLSWLLREFLSGCATYAEVMYPMPIAMGHDDGPLDQAAPTPVPAATRPRLFVVSDATRDTPGNDQPKQIAATGRLAVHEHSPRELEIVRSARAPAARRKNRPR